MKETACSSVPIHILTLTFTLTFTLILTTHPTLPSLPR